MQPRRGKVSWLDLCAIFVILALLVALFVPAIRQMKCGAATMIDGTYAKELHQSMLIFSQSNAHRLPIPSRVVKSNSGDSEEDYSLNHTAALYSFLVGADLVEPERLVSHWCVEVNPGVDVKTDYNFDAYQPANRSFWDPTFTMRIDDPDVGANCSYAHQALCGERRERWTNAADPTWPILGNRGTKDGVASGSDYARSPTLRLHGPEDAWAGNIVFADNHCSLEDTFLPNLSYYETGGEKERDNIFHAEFAHSDGNQAAGDAFLGVFIESAENSVVPVWDPLD